MEVLELLEGKKPTKKQIKEAPKQLPTPPQPVQQMQEEPKPKEKKPRTPAQIEAFKKVVAIREAKRTQRKDEYNKDMEEFRKYKESLIVKKAVSIKKKQLKQLKPLEDISDDETPIEEIKQIIKPVNKAQAIQAPIIKAPPVQPPTPARPIKPTFYFS